jgi:bacillopeptidase F (M6 metalloprotease family)
MPENSVDQVVYDADMLANVGFKNVAFRLASEEFLKEDLKKANENNTNAIEEAFKNVMEGVVKLDSVVLSSSAQKIAKERIQDVNRIFNYLKEKSVFKTILEKTSSISEKLQVNALVEDDSVMLKKKLLNEEISSAGMELGIDSKIINKFIM